MELVIAIIVGFAVLFGILYYVIKTAVTAGMIQAYYDMEEKYRTDIKNSVKYGIKEADRELDKTK